MLEAVPATSTTTAPAHQASGGFPPFAVETFPSQLFWLTITFAFLFVVLWRIAGPRIQGAIAARRDRINGDLKVAEQFRHDAEGASAAYETAIAGARARAQKLADENRKRIDGELTGAKAAADAEAQKTMAAAEAQIAGAREQARLHVSRAAQDAAIDIVARLIGDVVPANEAVQAVQGTGQ